MWRLSLCGVPLDSGEAGHLESFGIIKKKKTTRTSEVKITVFLHYESYWGARSGMLGFESEISIIGSCFII